MAVRLAEGFPQYLIHENLIVYERFIREHGWWNFVDKITPSLLAGVIRKFPDQAWKRLDQWVEDEHVQIRKAAVLS